MQSVSRKFNKLMILSPRALVHGYRWLDAISHEYMHYLITKLTANKAPIWFHEGLAEHDEAGWRGATPQLSPVHQTLLARAVESGRLISFERMEPGLVKLETPEDVQLAYAEAASAIEFIIGKAGHAAVRNVMKQMAASNEKGAGDAIKAVAGSRALPSSKERGKSIWHPGGLRKWRAWACAVTR